MGMKEASEEKVMEFGEYEELDEAFAYLVQTAKTARSPCEWVVLQEKARVLFEQLYSESTAGTCSKEESFFQTTDACFIINNT